MGGYLMNFIVVAINIIYRKMNLKSNGEIIGI